MQLVNMYLKRNDDTRNSIVISGMHKIFLLFTNPSSNLPESLYIKGLWWLRGCSNPSCTPHVPLIFENLKSLFTLQGDICLTVKQLVLLLRMTLGPIASMLF